MKNLPKSMKPSALIRLAVSDLSKVERDSKRYRVAMSTWHSPNSHCAVCFAGAVMAKTLDVPRDLDLGPSSRDYRNNYFFNEPTRQKLLALDEFRTGDVSSGLYYMGASDRAVAKAQDALGDERVRVPPYHAAHAHSRKFKAAMRTLATALKRIGL